MNQATVTRPARHLHAVPDPTPSCPPWCVSAHALEDPDDYVHLGPLETAGPIELYTQEHAGRATTVVQIGGYASESLDADEIDALITALQRHRATITTGAAR